MSVVDDLDQDARDGRAAGLVVGYVEHGGLDAVVSDDELHSVG